MPGQPLSAVLPSARLPYLLEVARTLARCHKAKVYHRGLSPECLWLADAGAPYVLHWDFSYVDGSLTTTEEVRARVKGSRYVAPEVRGDPTRANGAKADVYSLGAIAIELLTRPPLPADLAAAAAQAPSREVAGLLRHMVAARPEERPSMNEIASMLEEITRA